MILERARIQQDFQFQADEIVRLQAELNKRQTIILPSLTFGPNAVNEKDEEIRLLKQSHAAVIDAEKLEQKVQLGKIHREECRRSSNKMTFNVARSMP